MYIRILICIIIIIILLQRHYDEPGEEAREGDTDLEVQLLPRVIRLSFIRYLGTIINITIHV